MTTPGPGHNSAQTEDATPQLGGIAAEALRQIIERIERLDEEIAALNSDKKDVYAQAKAQGFDVGIIKRVIRLRRMEDQEREETSQLLDLYAAAIGMQLSLI